MKAAAKVQYSTMKAAIAALHCMLEGAILVLQFNPYSCVFQVMSGPASGSDPAERVDAALAGLRKNR
jgi:hypothetical protein